jgi:Protein of unknown function (DUF3570)
VTALGRRAATVLLGLSSLLATPEAGAEDPPPAATAAPAPPAAPAFGDVLDKPRPYFRIEAVNLRFTHYDQTGRGYQSRAGPPGGPGDERLMVEQPQLEVIAKQGDHLTHRIWLPVDIVTAASPDAIDLVSGASRTNEAGSFDWTATYARDKASVSMRNALHEEENYRSWTVGLAGTYALAEDNTVLSASANEVMDWFDKYLLNGAHNGHAARNSTNFNVGLTQLLSPTTIAHVDYGLTLQEGQLGNGWNTVPVQGGDFTFEVLPKTRHRHALSGKIAQYLPWNGAVHASYRFYADDWGILAHSMELELHQRLSSFSRLRLNYRYHTQTGADFFTTLVPTDAPARATADSDLAPLHAHTIGIKGSFDFPVRFAKNLHADLSVERYFRSNDLRVSVISCGLGLLF